MIFLWDIVCLFPFFSSDGVAFIGWQAGYRIALHEKAPEKAKGLKRLVDCHVGPKPAGSKWKQGNLRRAFGRTATFPCLNGTGSGLEQARASLRRCGYTREPLLMN